MSRKTVLILCQFSMSSSSEKFRQLAWQYICLSPLLLLWTVPSAAQFSAEQLEWLESDAEHPPAMEVNEGDLVFLESQSAKPEHHQSMHITITQETLRTGWATVSQCHENLDRVPLLEIVFRPGKVRNLHVQEFHNIADARPQGHRVILRQVDAHSRICVQSESRVMQRVDSASETTYEMSNGPFMRRFLDGYYPLILRLQVDYPTDSLRLQDVQPAAQPGWEIRYDAGRISLNGRFEGRLVTRFRFAPTHNAHD